VLQLSASAAVPAPPVDGFEPARYPERVTATGAVMGTNRPAAEGGLDLMGGQVVRDNRRPVEAFAERATRRLRSQARA
jgi:hypothetical protein